MVTSTGTSWSSTGATSVNQENSGTLVPTSNLRPTRTGDSPGTRIRQW